jgi:hypothetical protein
VIHHKDSCCLFVDAVVMIEQEAHLIPLGVDGSNAAAEGGDQVVDAGEQHVGQDGSFQMAPQSFDQVQVGAIWRKPIHLDPTPVPVQPVADGSGLMVSGIITHQTDPATRIDAKQGGQERDELQAALGVADERGDLAGGIIHGSVDHFLSVLARRGHSGLVPDLGPHPRQMRVGVDFGFVGEDQGLGRVLAERFFFSAVNSFFARAWAFSSRLPFKVCLGRCRENCS